MQKLTTIKTHQGLTKDWVCSFKKIINKNKSSKNLCQVLGIMIEKNCVFYSVDHTKYFVLNITIYVCLAQYSQVSISVTPLNIIISYMLRKFYSPTKTHLVRLVSVMC